jgi:hypothetical protein
MVAALVNGLTCTTYLSLLDQLCASLPGVPRARHLEADPRAGHPVIAGQITCCRDGNLLYVQSDRNA